MPELPEVETIARGLASHVTGDVIESVWLGSKSEPLKSAAPEIVAALENRRIADVRRVGKHIVFDLEPNGMSAAMAHEIKRTRKRSPHGRNGGTLKPKAVPEVPTALQADEARPIRPQWIVHLGMTGRMLVCQPEVQIEKHTHAIVTLASGRELRFVDPRRFGRLSVSPGFIAPGLEPLIIALQPFTNLFRARKTPIKSALLNQKLLSGVGNIYADESLFRAGVRPRRRAGSLTREDLKRLHASLQEVLKQAIALGGSSVADYVDAHGEQGFFQLQHRVYGREGEPCLACKALIKRVVIAGRSNHYCPKCQK